MNRGIRRWAVGAGVLALFCVCGCTEVVPPSGSSTTEPERTEQSKKSPKSEVLMQQLRETVEEADSTYDELVPPQAPKRAPEPAPSPPAEPSNGDPWGS